MTYSNSGNRTNGDDHFTAKFGANAGKRLGVGFKFDYLYARGYYQNQSTSHFDYTLYGSYIGDRYQAHLLFSTNHQKVTENGGVANDDYITHPESFSDDYSASEIPTVLERNWNRNDNLHVYFNHKYSLGFSRKVPMTEDEIKAKKFALASAEENKKGDNDHAPSNRNRHNAKTEERSFGGRPKDAAVVGQEPGNAQEKGEDRISINKATADSLMALAPEKKADTAWVKTEYVPVTSFIHTMSFDRYRRIYEVYQTPENFYAHTYKVDEKLTGDSIYDKTTHYRFNNTFAISLLEGFNKWAKAGLKAFISYDLKYYGLPDTLKAKTYTENDISIGGQISKVQGKLLHYNAMLEANVAGPNSGDLKIDARADLNFKLFGDTLSLQACAFLHRIRPSFYFRHYQGRHAWWDNDDLKRITHSRIAGMLLTKKPKQN